MLSHQDDIDKIYLYVKDPCEDKYQHLIKKREEVGQKHFQNPQAFIEYSRHINDVYPDINEYNPNK